MMDDSKNIIIQAKNARIIAILAEKFDGSLDKAIDVLDMSCVRVKNKNLKQLDKETIIEVIESNYNVKIETNNKIEKNAITA